MLAQLANQLQIGTKFPNHLGDFVKFIYKNQEFVENLLNDPTTKLGFCVDGTCCCGKTSICNNKITRYFDAPMRNRSASASLGFVFTGLDIMTHNNIPYETIWDRKPTNNLDWYRIWAMIDGIPAETVLNSLSIDVEEYYLKQFYTIQVIDSNQEAVKTRMAHRNQGSDFARYQLDDYVNAQNTFYKLQHERFPKYIALFDHRDYTNPFESLSLIVKHLVQFGTYHTNDTGLMYQSLDPNRKQPVDPLYNYSDQIKKNVFGVKF